MANQVAARIEGDDYQSLYFWYHAASMLKENSPIQKIVFEADGIPGCDDVIVYYKNGRDDAGKTVSSGVYFYRLTTTDKTLTKKMLLLK
jgi:hypothetical protein